MECIFEWETQISKKTTYLRDVRSILYGRRCDPRKTKHKMRIESHKSSLRSKYDDDDQCANHLWFLLAYFEYIYSHSIEVLMQRVCNIISQIYNTNALLYIRPIHPGCSSTFYYINWFLFSRRIFFFKVYMCSQARKIPFASKVRHKVYHNALWNIYNFNDAASRSPLTEFFFVNSPHKDLRRTWCLVILKKNKMSKEYIHTLDRLSVGRLMVWKPQWNVPSCGISPLIYTY